MYMDCEPRVHPNTTGPRLRRHAVDIEFREVCFSYDPGHPILTGVHLRVRHGETIALVGKNGCGKSTLVGLIPRFYDPDHGSVLIDGIDVRTANVRSLRQQIGIVTQDTVLFDDTIARNIAYGHSRASQEEIEKAARQAFAHDFIAKLPHGYDTRIGEAGTKLSGGQKQRIALARAILRNPSILILDEFTSQSDAESEALVHQALREFVRGRTTFVVTHRLNTLEIADRIVVVENGRVAAVGTHQELLKASPLYQRLHEAHFQRMVA
jgi:ABC-type multidrug transport system fused ATPase/permease subunit